MTESKSSSALLETIHVDEGDRVTREQIRAFTTEAWRQLPYIRRNCNRYSLTEYFTFVAHQGLRALEEGNYGIGAIYIYRHDGKEYVVVARNQILTKGDTGAHAEEEVLNAVESIGRGQKTYRRRLIMVRPRPAPYDPNHTERIIATGIEPCIGCYRRILTHKVDQVWSGWPDTSGALHQDDVRLPFWEQIRMKQGLLPTLVNNEIDSALSQMIWNMFAINRRQVDELLKTQGLAHMRSFPKHAAQIWNHS